ncbi:MAG: DUF3808 domain-containing protein [Bacteroidetes bacterium]|nr:DUF3808 domain-containing protein [Bacteroidota bacterium]MCW5896295.1 DUF3808 domain-containing protein [Bacteroidota bacterium]
MRLTNVKTMALAVCLLWGSIAQSGPPDGNRVHELTVHGLNRLYALEIDEALSAFDSVSKLAPRDPRGPFFQSMVYFYLYGLERDEHALDAFLENSERVIEICDYLLDRDQKDAVTKFYLGGIYGYRGLAHHTHGSLLKAARDGRKGYLLLEEAVSDNPVLYDAQMGFGLFRYLIAKVPRSMRWILSVLGFSGDLEGGLNGLRLAAEKGTYTRTEAKLFLAQFLFSEGRRDTALIYLNELRTEYPENTLFMVLYAFWQHRLNNYEEAMAAAKSAIKLNNRKKIRYGDELAYSTLGSIYFTLNDFANSSSYYRQYKEMTHKDERIPNWTYYRAGLACEISGDRASALEFYQRMRDVKDRDRVWDTQMYRRVQQLIQRPMTEAERQIIQGENAFARKRYDEATRLHHLGLEKAAGNPDHEGRALYGILQSSYEEGQFDSAVVIAGRLLALNPPNETWVLPHGWYKLGQVYVKLQNYGQARMAFERALRFKDYDFQTRLESNAREELKKLDQAR